jgi:sensor c-di-GMP phosphodiesterase-like protein
VYGVVRKFLPVMVGLALASIPFAVFEFWLDGRVEFEARSEVSSNARRGVAVINARLSRVAAALESVSIYDAVCQPEQLEALRMTTFKTSPIKEISILGLDSQTSCTDSGLKLGPRQVVGQPQATSIPDTFVEILHFADLKQSMIRVRRVLANGDAVGALVALDTLVPTASAQAANGQVVHGRVQGRDGTLIAEVNMAAIAQVPASELFFAQADSETFGIQVSVWRTRAEVMAAISSMRINGLIVCGAIGLIALGLSMLLMRRRAQSPTERLAAALAAGEFVPYYQPIIDINTGKLIGAEVLVRWRKPDGSIGMPGTFISQMEDNGLVQELSKSLMRQACRDLAQVYGRCANLRVSFNLTAEEFENEATVGEIRSIFFRSPVRLSQIVLELTERQEPSNFNKTRQVIASMQVLGCKVALDDVGTGHSGLSSILKLGVDIIKIDKMFVDSMDDDRNSAAIIATLVDLAHKLGMDTVAEGVEHFEQVTELRRRGIRAAQGFVFSPALPATAYVQLIDALYPVGGTESAMPVKAVA